MEAARSLGLPFGKAMRRVILPQGSEVALPSVYFLMILSYSPLAFNLARPSLNISTTIIYIFRGLPLIVLALFIYNGVPSLIGSKVPAFLAGVITLMLNEGAYTAAFVKGGIFATLKSMPFST